MTLLLPHRRIEKPSLGTFGGPAEVVAFAHMRNEVLTKAWEKEMERSRRNGGEFFRRPDSGVFFEVVVITPKPYSKELCSEVISPSPMATSTDLEDLPPSILSSTQQTATERLYLLYYHYQYWHLQWEAIDQSTRPPVIPACTKIRLEADGQEGGGHHHNGGGYSGNDDDDGRGGADEDDDDDDDDRGTYLDRIRYDPYATGLADTYISRRVIVELTEGRVEGSMKSVSTKQERNLFAVLHPIFKDNYRAFASAWNMMAAGISVNGTQHPPSHPLYVSYKSHTQLKEYADNVSQRTRNEQGRPITPPPFSGGDSSDEQEEREEGTDRRQMDDHAGDRVGLHREREQVLRRRLSSGAHVGIRDPPPVAPPNLTFEEIVAAQERIITTLPPPVPSFGSNFAQVVVQHMDQKRAPRMCRKGCGGKAHKGQCPRSGAGRPSASSSSRDGNEWGEDLSNRQGNGEGQRTTSGDIMEI